MIKRKEKTLEEKKQARIEETTKISEKIKEENPEILNLPKKRNCKYNWQLLKLEYMASSYLEVEPYLMEIHGIKINGGHTTRKTKGWQKEKREMMEKLSKEILARNERRIKESWEKIMEKVEDAHIEGLGILAQQIFEIAKSGNKNTFEIINILKHFRLEKGQATNIVKEKEDISTKEFLEQMENEEKENQI